MAKTPEIDLREEFGRNYIINGNFDFWQRGTSLSSTGAFLADRWRYTSSGTTVDLTRQTDVPASATSATYSKKVQRSLGGVVPGAADSMQLEYRMEGRDLIELKGKPFILSFWVKADLAGEYPLSFRNSALNRSYVTSYTISSANTWEYKTITLTHDASGSWNYDHLEGMRISWNIGAGTNFQTATLNAWQSGNFLRSTTARQVISTTGGFIQLSQVQIIEGFTDLPFRMYGKHIQSELTACQRYFELLPYRWRYTISAGTGEMQQFYKVTKRALPTLSSTADTVSPETSGSGNGLESVRLTFTTNASNGLITADAEL